MNGQILMTPHDLNDVTQYQGEHCREVMRLSELLDGILPISPARDRWIANLQLSSQNVKSGDLFIALPGVTTDGRDYIPQALQQGAAAVLYERQDADTRLLGESADNLFAIDGLKMQLGKVASKYFDYPSASLTTIGITGTNGKTTIAFLLAQSLKVLGQRCGYSGTIGAGQLGHLLKTPLTTADAITVHGQLADMVRENMDAVCMEVSSHGLDQGRVNGVEFDLAVFTNLTQDHLDYHQTMALYAKAKRKLFEFESLTAAVINTDDEFGAELKQYCADHSKSLNCITFGCHNADVMPECLVIDDQGISFQITDRDGVHHFSASLLGSINLSNVLATIASLKALGYRYEEIAPVISQLSPPPGRMEVFRNRSDQPAVVVDYAHTPDALERALSSLKSLCRGKLVVIFGCGGDRDQGKRPLMGQVAEKLADQIVLTDDNPRTEDPQQIVKQIRKGIGKQVKVEHDRRAATAFAISVCNADDIILLAGKGHEDTQVIDDQIVALSDREFVTELLGAST